MWLDGPGGCGRQREVGRMMEGWESKVPLNPGPHRRSRVRPLPKPGVSEIHVDHPYPHSGMDLVVLGGQMG